MSGVLGLLTAAALAAPLHVGAGQPHATLADAMVVAQSGDQLVLHDRVMNEGLTVDGLELEIVSVVGTRWTGPGAYQAGVLDLTNAADVTVRGVRFDGYGGAQFGVVADTGASLTVEQCEFEDFWASAVYHTGTGTVDVTDTTFRRQWAADEPALLIDNGDLTVTRSRFVSNVAGGQGGAIYQTGSGLATVRHSVFVHNMGQDGTITCFGDCVLEDNLFVANEAWVFGAAVLAGSGQLDMVRNRICGNSASLGQGAVVLFGTQASLRNNLFLDNDDAAGGVAVVSDSADVELVQNTVAFNDSLGGAGAFLFWGGTASLDGNLVLGNTGPSPAGEHGDGAVVTSEYNAWYDNAGGDATWALSSTELVGVDPTIAAAGRLCSFDRVRPLAGSPLIDAGDPALNDPDGSPADIGVTGGPDAPL